MDLTMKDVKFSITPQNREEGDSIHIQISGAETVSLNLTPQQARALASDLIQTVYRAEVKNSLLSRERRVVSKPEAATDKYSMQSPHAA